MSNNPEENSQESTNPLSEMSSSVALRNKRALQNLTGEETETKPRVIAVESTLTPKQLAERRLQSQQMKAMEKDPRYLTPPDLRDQKPPVPATPPVPPPEEHLSEHTPQSTSEPEIEPPSLQELPPVNPSLPTSPVTEDQDTTPKTEMTPEEVEEKVKKVEYDKAMAEATEVEKRDLALQKLQMRQRENRKRVLEFISPAILTWSLENTCNREGIVPPPPSWATADNEALWQKLLLQVYKRDVKMSMFTKWGPTVEVLLGTKYMIDVKWTGMCFAHFLIQNALMTKLPELAVVVIDPLSLNRPRRPRRR